VACQLVENQQPLNPDDLVSVIYGLCKFHFNEDSGKTLGVLTARVRRNLSLYTLTDISQIISSLARVGVCNRPLVSDITPLITPESIEALSNRSLSNLMTGLARFGAKSSPKNPIWDILANEVIRRLQSDSQWSLSDLLATTLAYSVSATPNRDVLDRFFSIVSHHLLSVTLDLQSVSKYIKACSRVEFRDVETLSHCASSLRQIAEFPFKVDTRDLLQIYTNLDKLGIEMKDLEDELTTRDIAIPSNKSVTWFPASRQKSPKKETRQNQVKSDSLRKRKYSW